MRRTSNYTRMLLSVVCLILCMSIHAYGSDTVVFFQDFSGVSDQYLSSDMIPESKSGFSAEIKDEALVLKSDSMCYYRVDDAENLNGETNAHGMTLQCIPGVVVTALESPITVGGREYDYRGPGNAAIHIAEIGGKNALMQSTYVNLPAGADPGSVTNYTLRTNAARLVVDKNQFLDTDNDMMLELEYYTEDIDGNWCKVTYPGKDGSKKTVMAYDAEKIKKDGAGQWNRIAVALPDADFSRYIREESGYEHSILLETRDQRENYFHSVTLYKNGESEIKDAAIYNIVQMKMPDDGMYGDATISYDLKFPGGEKLTDTCDYNSGQNVMSVNLLNANRMEMASVLYEMTNGIAKIYVISDTEKVKVYEGDVMDKTLRYTVAISVADKTYTLAIDEGDERKGETENPVALKNREGGSNVGVVRFINAKHNPYSSALLSVFDNIEVSVSENEGYRNCMEDADHIALAVTPGSAVMNDFDLPTLGSLHASEIAWRSSDESAIEIVNQGTEAFARVKQSDSPKAVSLYATVTNNGFFTEKKFDFTVRAVTDAYLQRGKAEIRTKTDGSVTAKISLKNPGTTGAAAITFAVMSVDSRTGDICNQKFDVKTEIPKYGNLTFEVEGLQKNGGDEIVYYLWDENDMSLINHAPTDLSGFRAENRVRGVKLLWEESHDDYNAIDYYAVYRDGTLIARCSDTEYIDTEAIRGKTYRYTVTPVDTNENCGTAASGEGEKIGMPYYLEPIGNDEASINRNGNGIYMAYRDDPARAAYTEYAEVTDADRNIVPCRYVPNGKYIGFYTDKNIVKERSKVAVKITYLDTRGKLIFKYNTVIPSGREDSAAYAEKEIACGEMTNTNTWKELVVEIEDAQFRESLFLTASDFALQTTGGSGVYVRKVELAELDVY